MMLWNRTNRRKREKPAAPPAEPLTPLALTWLLVALALAVAPHARELSVWLTVLFVAILGWRWFIAMRGRSLPSRWLLLVAAV